MKNIMKIIFDIIMLLLVLMIYSVSATGVLFHEIAGLIIFLLFVIHILYNRKWIVQVQKRMFDTTFSKKSKVLYITDILIFLMFLVSGISGILISKEVFKFGFVYIWRYVHIISSAICLLLLGVHIGLHRNMIINIIRKYIHLPIVIGRIITVLVLFVIFGLGIYGIVVSEVKQNKDITVKNLLEDVFTKKEGMEIERNDGQLKKEEHGQNKEKIEEKDNQYNGKSVLIISSGFLSIIILCSIIIGIIENRIKKKRKTAYCT